MTVPNVPNRSPERRERGANPFLAFPLPMGGNVGNARAKVEEITRDGDRHLIWIKALTLLWPLPHSRAIHA